ncbi:MAG: hypothetical protein K2X67_03640 [Burkholderiales bacterium]|nr:hypothetical protein [Burkholderiales bacterium]
MKRSLVIGLGCLVFVAAPSFAQTPPQLDDYRWQVGSYRCVGETAGEGAHPFTATYSLTRDLDGGVYLERYIEAKTAQHQQPFSIIHLYTYDTKNQRYVRNGVDGNGGRHEHTSTGWSNGVWIWDAGGFRIPITRGENQFSFKAELMKDGNWVLLASGVCKK